MASSNTGEKRRVWEIQSQCYHNNEAVWTEEIVENVVNALLKEKKDENGKPTIRYAWCKHDKDVYLPENIEELRFLNPGTKAVVGQKRPAHIHLMLEFANATYKSSIYKTIHQFTNLGKEHIRRPQARYYQFLAMATYLTHCRAEEQAKGKFRYSDDEVHCNFDYRKEVNKYLLNKDKTLANGKINPRVAAEQMINRIERGELSINEAKQESKELLGYAFFLRHEKEFRLARGEYIKSGYEMKSRINYYICGPSGAGKSTLAKRLAMALYPELEDNECYFIVGDEGVRFDQYEWQPVIIWDDVRADHLLREHGYEKLLNILDLNPTKKTYNIKFGNVILTHQVNIFTCTVPFLDFSEALMAGSRDKKNTIPEEKDKEQIRRRFPVVINLLENNKVVIECNTRIYDNAPKSEFKTYAVENNVNIRLLNIGFTGEALDYAFDIITKPIVNLHHEFMHKHSSTNKDDVAFFKNIITVVEGYEDVEEENKRPGFHEYRLECEEFIREHRIEPSVEYYDAMIDGTESDNDDIQSLKDFSEYIPPIEDFGPYKSEPNWTLGDPLTGGYTGAYCPFTYEQWLEKKEKTDDSQEDIYVSEDYQESGELEKKNKEIEPYRHSIISYLNAKKQGLPSQLPAELREDDVRYFEENMMTDDEFEIVYGKIDYTDCDEVPKEFQEAYREIETATLAKAEAYISGIMAKTEEFVKTKTEEALKQWAHALFDGYEYNEIRENFGEDVKTWRCVIECWHTVREVSIKHGLAHDCREWYSLYQRLNSESVSIDSGIAESQTE